MEFQSKDISPWGGSTWGESDTEAKNQGRRRKEPREQQGQWCSGQRVQSSQRHRNEQDLVIPRTGLQKVRVAGERSTEQSFKGWG